MKKTCVVCESEFEPSPIDPSTADIRMFLQTRNPARLIIRVIELVSGKEVAPQEGSNPSRLGQL